MRKRVKSIFGVLLMAGTALLFAGLAGDGDLLLSIAPFVLPAIGAGLGMVQGALGMSEEEKRNEERRKMILAYRQQMDRARIRAAENEKRTDAMYSGRIAERRGNLNAKMGEYGLDPVGSMYSNEKDLIDANVTQQDNIEGNMLEQTDALQGNIDGLNAQMETPESLGSKIIGGGLKGFNLGSQIGGALFPQKLDPNNTTTTPTATDPVSTPGSVNPVSDIYNRKKKLSMNKYGAVSLPQEYSLP